MPHLRVQQMKAVLQAHLFDRAVRGGIKLRTLPAVLQIDLIHITHQFQRPRLSHMLMQAAAEIVRNIVFPVRKGAGAAESAHNGAGFAADAVFHLVPVDRAFSPVQRVPEFKYADLQRCLRLLVQFIGGEDPARSRTDDQHIIIHLVQPQSFCSVDSLSTAVSCPPSATENYTILACKIKFHFRFLTIYSIIYINLVMEECFCAQVPVYFPGFAGPVCRPG